MDKDSRQYKDITKRAIKSALVCLAGILFAGCASTAVTLSRIEPPEYDIPPDKNLAVLDFVSYSDHPQSGRAIASSLVAKLAPTEFYNLIERAQIENVIRELKFATTDYVDPSYAQEIGEIVGADYVIVGEVTAYDIEDDVEYEQVTDQVMTGRYRYDRRGVRIPEFRTVVRTVEIRIRRGTVSATFRLIDVPTGRVIASDQQTRSYRQSTEGGRSSSSLPAREYILSRLTDEVAEAFVKKIAPHQVFERRRLEYGKHSLIRKGVNLAKNGLWREAFSTWNEARQITPNDPAIYNNMGVAAELKGDYEAAESFYQKALELKPDNTRYMQNLRRVRRFIHVYEDHPLSTEED